MTMASADGLAARPRRAGANTLTTLTQNCAVLPGQLWRRFAFFLGGAFGFADGDHELSLLTGEFAPACGPAPAPDLSEVRSHFARECKPLARGHQSIVNGLR